MLYPCQGPHSSFVPGSILQLCLETYDVSPPVHVGLFLIKPSLYAIRHFWEEVQWKDEWWTTMFTSMNDTVTTLGSHPARFKWKTFGLIVCNNWPYLHLTDESELEIWLRSCRGGGSAKNKQLKILRLLYTIKQLLYAKPHWSRLLLSFDRSNAAEDGCRGERGRVCACVWSPECHRAARRLPLNIPDSTSAWYSIWNQLQVSPSLKKFFFF